MEQHKITPQSLLMIGLLALFAIQLSSELTPRDASANPGAFVNHIRVEAAPY